LPGQIKNYALFAQLSAEKAGATTWKTLQNIKKKPKN